MSVEIWSIALNAKLGNPAKKAVLLGMANHASPDGKHCYPSVKRLAIYSELSESTVRMKLAELREEKIIIIVRNAYRYRPTEYEINVDKLKVMRNTDLHLLEASSDTPISGGTTSQEKKKQPSKKPTPGLQENNISPPRDRGEPSLTIKEPLKDLRVKITRNTNDRIRRALEHQFIESTNLRAPPMNTIKQKKAAGELWWTPLREISELADLNLVQGRFLIRRTVDQMRKDNLTISSPKSILNVAKSIVAEGTGRSISGAREFLDDLRRTAN